MDANILKSGDTIRHYGGEEYIVVCIAKHTETNEEMVVYSPKCSSSNSDKVCYVSLLSVFDDMVQIKVPRFKRIIARSL
ncbi:MAG: DUF1653 domain-containing protein [Candidatus Amoebophilus sp.]